MSRTPLLHSAAGVALLVFCALLLVFVPSASAFAPMPPVMQTLLRIYPEGNGWFVEEPLGVAEHTPEKAEPYFRTFRVVVPNLESLELAVARALSAANTLPIKRVHRFDRKPTAPDFAGFRGVWCELENSEQIGFSIVTPNQNRFLIWAKYQYFPAWGDESINHKTRDAYARDVSQYLAGIDAGVPDNDPPVATQRQLPDSLDIYTGAEGTALPARIDGLRSRYQQIRKNEEIRAWGLKNVKLILPTVAGIADIIDTAPDTLWPNREIGLLQHDWRHYVSEAGLRPQEIRCATAGNVRLEESAVYLYAVDRYGRLRYVPAQDVLGDSAFALPAFGYSITTVGAHALLFP
ncbi:MAG TPA: hypothetical protein VLB27_05390, partial [candidate division Zixibacteria bacterium]|nr:hypothetical protein [candidate division Zixibacteria bacterium]